LHYLGHVKIFDDDDDKIKLAQQSNQTITKRKYIKDKITNPNTK